MNRKSDEELLKEIQKHTLGMEDTFSFECMLCHKLTGLIMIRSNTCKFNYLRCFLVVANVSQFC